MNANSGIRPASAPAPARRSVVGDIKAAGDSHAGKVRPGTPRPAGDAPEGNMVAFTDNQSHFARATAKPSSGCGCSVM